ncbi:hypothetical protein XENOCAPTIV_024282, partial [Xenoophorus captivus]
CKVLGLVHSSKTFPRGFKMLCLCKGDSVGKHRFRSRPGVGHCNGSGRWFHPSCHPHPLPPHHWKVPTI